MGTTSSIDALESINYKFRIINYKQKIIFSGYYRTRIVIHFMRNKIPKDIITLCFRFYFVDMLTNWSSIPSLTFVQQKQFLRDLADICVANQEYFLGYNLLKIRLDIDYADKNNEFDIATIDKKDSINWSKFDEPGIEYSNYLPSIVINKEQSPWHYKYYHTFALVLVVTSEEHFEAAKFYFEKAMALHVPKMLLYCRT